MTRGRGQARRGPTKGANISAGDADAVSGFLLLFCHLFLPSLERKQERKFFVFCVPLAALGLLGQPLLPARAAARGSERRRGPPPTLLYRLHISEPFSPGKHGRGKSVGNKIQPWETRRESKAPAGRASLADHAADTSLAKVNLSPGAAHTRKSRSACRTDWKLKVRCVALRLGAALGARACSLRSNTDSRLAISLRCIMLNFFVVVGYRCRWKQHASS